MAKEGPSPISEESIDFLEDVKKGKPRKFAMICKGSEIVSLVVYKKGNVEKRRKEAKEAGKGQFYFGVLNGKGIDLRFLLARSDGFESPPVKTAVLKGFLDEKANIKCKPLFEIVDATPLALDESDPLVTRFVNLQSAIESACNTQPDMAQRLNTLCRQIGSALDQDQSDEAASLLSELEKVLSSISVPSTDMPRAADSATTSPGAATTEAESGPSAEQTTSNAGAPPTSVANEFKSRFKELLAAVQLAGTSLGEGVKQQLKQAGELAQKQDYPQAHGLLDEVEKLLKASQTTPVKPDPESEFKRRLQELLPGIQLAKAKSSEGQQIALLASEAGTLARKRDFPAALGLLERVAGMLEQLARPGEDEATQFTSRLKLLKPRLDEAFKVDSPASRELKLVASQAAALARTREFASAIRLLAEAEKLVGQIENSTTSGPSAPLPTLEPATYLKLEMLWQAAQKSAAEQLAELGRQLLLLPEVQQDERISEVQQAVARLPKLIPKFGNVLNNYLKRAAQGGSDVEQCRQDALRTLDTYRKQLSGAPALRQLAEFAQKNLKVQLSSSTELETALREVETGLTTAP